MTDRSGLGYIHKRVIHRLRLKWYRMARQGYVMKGDPFRQIWVDPKSINTSLPVNTLKQEDYFSPIRKGRFCKYLAIGMVEDGDWDQQVVPYEPEQGLLFRAMEERFHSARLWQDTEFYSHVLEQIEKGFYPWNGCRDINDVLDRCVRADRLIESIKLFGFRENNHPVVVCIGEEGNLIKAGNGQHRIILGLITGSKIPVLPVVRHKKWETYRVSRLNRHSTIGDHPDIL